MLGRACASVLWQDGGMGMSPSAETLARRVRTVSRLIAITMLSVVLAPALFLLAVVVDMARFVVNRRPFMSVRVLAFGFVYLWAELQGLLSALLDRSIDGGYAAQARWGSSLFVAVRALFSLRFVVQGDEVISQVMRPIVLVRHTSIIDSLVAPIFITKAHGLRLRFVLKRELLEDPCFDIVGTRLPNHFVARTRDGTVNDLTAIRLLAAGLAHDEGVLIYPEGTRFTVAKRARAIQRMAKDDSAHLASAQSLVNLLPPKPAGVSALLDGAPWADAIFVAHEGLDGFASVSDIWSGALLGRNVRVRMWRVARADIPDEPVARTQWLYGEWRKMDAWLSS